MPFGLAVKRERACRNRGGGQSRVKFKAQIWEINFLGPGKEKGKVEGGERGGVLPSVCLSKRLVGQET